MTERQKAIACIAAAFQKCAQIEEANFDVCEDVLDAYVEAYATAWEKLHRLLRRAGLQERSLAYLMEMNRALSGDDLMASGAVRYDADAASDDVARLHDQYVASLAAISRILEGADNAAQP